MPESYYDMYLPLIWKKNWIEAFALIVLLNETTITFTNITQKLCWELLKSPTKWKKALEVLKYYECVVWNQINHKPNMEQPDMQSDNNEFSELASHICKQVRGNYPACNNLLNYWVGSQLIKAAKIHNLTEEEFITIFIKEIMKDEFWKKILTWETFIRKFDNLYAKFWSKIPKRPAWGLGSISDIF